MVDYWNVYVDEVQVVNTTAGEMSEHGSVGSSFKMTPPSSHEDAT